MTDILTSLPEDLDTEEWLALLPTIQEKIVEAEQAVKDLREARNRALAKILEDSTSCTLGEWTYRKAQNTEYSLARLNANHPEAIDAIKAKLRESYDPKITKGNVDRYLKTLDPKVSAEILASIIEDGEVRFSATKAKSKEVSE